MSYRYKYSIYGNNRVRGNTSYYNTKTFRDNKSTTNIITQAQATIENESVSGLL